MNLTTKNPKEFITIKGAKVHNLKNVDLVIPRNKFIVISEAGSDFALCVDELIGIEALDGHVFQETEKVFPEKVAKFFPFFIEESDEIKLIMKPEGFTNSESLLDYKKN